MTKHGASLGVQEFEAVVTLIEEAKTCYGEAEVANVQWLRRQEIWALTSLRRLDEALDATIEFESQYFDSITDEMKARFLMDKDRLHILRGEAKRAEDANDQGNKYKEALRPGVRARFLLNRANHCRDAGRPKEAALYVDDATKLLLHLGRDMSRFERFMYGQAMHLMAEIDLELKELSRAESNVKLALEVFRDQGRDEYTATATTTLGRVQIAQGKVDTGLLTIRTSLAFARDSSLVRPMVVALHRLGGALNDLEQNEEAEAHVREALVLSDSVGLEEFRTELLITLGRALLDQGVLARAESVYLEAEARAGSPRLEGLARVGLLRVEQARNERLTFWINLSMVLTLILGYLGGYFYASRRNRPVVVEPIGEDEPSKPVDEVLLSLIRELCFEPEKHKDKIEAVDPELYCQLSGSDQKDLQSVKVLSLALATVEGYEGNSPYARYRRKLSDLRAALGWRARQPKGVYGWRLWFMEQAEQ